MVSLLRGLGFKVSISVSIRFGFSTHPSVEGCWPDVRAKRGRGGAFALSVTGITRRGTGARKKAITADVMSAVI
jgi:hypothetical protein